MRRFIAGLLMLAALVCLLAPTASFTEDRATIRLARTLYALGKTESYETKLALGSVVMNRIDDPWFPNSLDGVLREQQQFPAGERYDAESLRAAHALLAGARRLPPNALYYRSADAPSPLPGQTRVATSGSYSFYA